jgi:hypothetical protein
MTRLSALLLLLVVVALATGWWACQRQARGAEARRSHEQAFAALERVTVGMPLESAKQELTHAPGFWRHAVCGGDERQSNAFHLFFFGAHDPDLTAVVTLGARGQPGQLVVSDLGRLSIESTRGFYSACRDVTTQTRSGHAVEGPALST